MVWYGMVWWYGWMHACTRYTHTHNIYIYISTVYTSSLQTMYAVFLAARPTCLKKQVLDKSMELRTAVTMRRDFVPLLPEGTKFFHPLCLG